MKTINKPSDLLDCRGLEFEANIDGTICKGKVQVEKNKVYLCQDVKDGSPCEDRLGYKYSWVTYEKSIPDSFDEWYVSNFKLIESKDDPFKDWQVGAKLSREGNTHEIIFRSGELIICKNHNNIASSNYTCQEVYEKGFRLQTENPEGEKPQPITVTLEEIALWKGVSKEMIIISHQQD